MKGGGVEELQNISQFDFISSILTPRPLWSMSSTAFSQYCSSDVWGEVSKHFPTSFTTQWP